jgi:hypothetical protein
MTSGSFTPESLGEVWDLLYSENKFLGQCGQKKLREQAKGPRTPAQEQADQARSQALGGKSVGANANRSEAAKKAAETRRRCKGLSGSAPSTNNTGTV